MEQTYTSKNTSINSGKLPAVFNRVRLTAPVILDYGSGRYTDHIRERVESHPGTVYCPYDPFNQSEHENQLSLYFVRLAEYTRTPVEIVCSNVLNVIDNDMVIHGIANTIQRIVSNTAGTAYITVYEGNRSGIGKQTGTDQYQRNAPLRDYLRFFRSATIHNGVMIVK